MGFYKSKINFYPVHQSFQEFDSGSQKLEITSFYLLKCNCDLLGAFRSLLCNI